MAVSKQLRFTTAFFILIFCIENMFLSVEMNAVNPSPFNNFQLLPVLINISITAISCLLLAVYFSRQKLWFSLIGIVVLDSVGIVTTYFDYLVFSRSYWNEFIADFITLSYPFLLPFFCLSILLSKAKNYTWLKVYAIISLFLVCIDEIALATNFRIDWLILDLVFNACNIFLILHLLFPDYHAKRSITEESDIIDHHLG